MTRGSTFATAAVAVAALAACGDTKRQQRSGDAAPVEIRAMLPDAASGKPGSSDEVEPNDGDDAAMALGLGASIRGRIDPDGDVDHYRIEVIDRGALAIEVAPVEGDLVLELEDASGIVVARSDRGAAKVKEGVPNFGVGPGRYTAVVRMKKPPPPKGRARRGPPPPAPAPVIAIYDITAQVAAPAASAEHEPDDDRGTANEVLVGDSATGFIGWTGDSDVWKLSVEALSARNAVDLELGPVENIAFTLEVADGLGRPLLVRKAPRGAGLFVRGLVPALPPGAPHYHYLVVKADRSNPETPYQLRIAGTVPGPDAELEPNDAADKPHPIPEDRTVVHATWSAGDVDCFAIAPDQAARTLETTIDTPEQADLRAELFVDGASVAKVDRGKKGAAEKIAGPVPAGARAVVCVRGTEIAGEGDYDVTIHDAPPPP